MAHVLDSFTDGAQMDALRKSHVRFRTAIQESVVRKSRAAAAHIKKLMEWKSRANRNLGGLRVVHCIPDTVMAAWAAKFKTQDEESGIYHTTGWECWREGSGFYEWFKRENPQFFLIEEKSGNSIIVPAAKYERVITAKPPTQIKVVPKNQGGPVIIAQ